MATQIIFNPVKIETLACPFSFFIKSGSTQNNTFRHLDYSHKNIEGIFKNLSAENRSALTRFTPKNLKKISKKIETDHKTLTPNKPLDDYLEKHLSTYYYKAFQQCFRILEKNQHLLHKIKIGDRRYRNLPCSFVANHHPGLSFRLIRKGKGLTVTASYRLKGAYYTENEVKRFRFLICRRDLYYVLKKTDWDVLKTITGAGTFSYSEFIEKYKKTLKRYPLDTNGVFKEETRRVKPETLIQISELSGDLLLFIPRWDYEGTIVEDNNNSFTVYKSDKQITYPRDKKTEQKTLDFLRNAHPNFKGQTNFFLTFDQANQKNWFFNFYYDQLKDNFTITGMDMLRYFRYSDHQAESKLQIQESSEELISARFSTHFGNEKIDLKTLQKALIQGDRFILLKDNSLGTLSDDWLEKYGMILKNATVDGDQIQFAKWLLLSLGPDDNHCGLKTVLPALWLKKWKTWNQSKEQLYQKPQTVKATLRNYQQKGFEWLNMMAEINAGTMLADDMGLGKTLQSIASMSYWKKNRPDAKFMIVSPASLIYNWKNEFEKFAPELNLFIYHGSNRDIADFTDAEKDVLITSYALIRNDIDMFSETVWEAIVLDEGHHIKNYTAQQTQAVFRLEGKHRIILNGTPIMNNIGDLYPQLHFLLPRLFLSKKRFYDQFVKPIEQKNSETEMGALKKLTAPFILRRTKESAAADLPRKTESVFWCDMGDEQRFAYESIKDQVRENILLEIDNKGLNKAKLGVLQGITKLRQVCSSPRLLKEEPEFSNNPSIKIDTLIETLTSDLAGQKIIVFSQFLGTMDLLSEAFERQEISYRRFSGKTAAKERMRLVSEFQDENSTIQVFLLSLMAGNSGINLTNANYVFLVEPWWNKAVQQQAIDRVHRIGQKQNVFAYNMICKDTIEEKIMALQKKKQMLSDEVIADDANFLKTMTEEDIAFLFE